MTNEIITCKECKWWDDLGACTNDKDELFEEGISIKSDCIYIKCCKDDKLLTEYCACLITGANFGCIHGEKKEKSSNEK